MGHGRVQTGGRIGADKRYYIADTGAYSGSLLSPLRRCLLAARASTRPYSVKSRPILFTMYCSNKALQVRQQARTSSDFDPGLIV